MAIDDICPGDFAPEPTVVIWMRTGVERIDWRAAERNFMQNLETLRAADRAADLAFIRGMPDPGRHLWVTPIASDPDPFDAETPDCTVDAYPMSIGEPTLDNCPACRGTGEINEFPADDDERLVACPTCGGTGEVYE